MDRPSTRSKNDQTPPQIQHVDGQLASDQTRPEGGGDTRTDRKGQEMKSEQNDSKKKLRVGARHEDQKRSEETPTEGVKRFKAFLARTDLR